jgi:hypothetical protein
MTKKLFKAQALAIVMLILVIASIMGVSLFSRMAKDKDIAVNEQDSAIAIAQVDAMLDYLIGADIGQVEGVLTNSENPYPYEINSINDFVDFLREYDVIDSEVEPFAEAWCISTDNSDVQVILSFADSDTFAEVQPGSVLAFNLEDLSCSSSDDGCRLTVRMKSVGDYSAFLVKRIIDDPTDGVSETKQNYCITDDGAGCTSNDYGDNLGNIIEGTGGTWSTINTGTDGNGDLLYYINFELDQEVSNNVVEIRVLPVSGVLAFNNVQPEDVTDRNFLPIKIAAEATCNVTRGEEMYLPGSGLLGYSTLFDFGIYDSGFFQP